MRKCWRERNAILTYHVGSVSCLLRSVLRILREVDNCCRRCRNWSSARMFSCGSDIVSTGCFLEVLVRTVWWAKCLGQCYLMRQLERELDGPCLTASHQCEAGMLFCSYQENITNQNCPVLSIAFIMLRPHWLLASSMAPRGAKCHICPSRDWPSASTIRRLDTLTTGDSCK